MLKLVPEFLKIINPTRFAIYFDTLGIPDVQFSQFICISDIHMDHLAINVDQFLWIPSIAEISPRFFEDNYPYQIYDILWHFGGPRYAILESICIIYVDVDHYKNILDYLLVVPSSAPINPIFFCNN